MGLRFDTLKQGDLQWLMNLRNVNHEWFMDEKTIPDLRIQELWFKFSTQKGDLNFIIKHDDDYIGFISIYNISASAATIGRMMTEFKFRRQGYMEKSMIKAFKLCKDILGLEQLILEVKKDNIPARDLYTKMGFVTYGITHNSLVMRKLL